jgi:prophage regulatory protein
MMKKLVSTEQLAELVPYSQNQLRRLEAAGEFPKRVKIGKNRVAWIQEELDQWLWDRMQERKTNTTEEKTND